MIPITCTDEPEGKPVITSLSASSGTNKETIQLNGCNFSGFEGDKHVWIENSKGTKGILYSEKESTSKQLTITLKPLLCQTDVSYSDNVCDTFLPLEPGTYKLFVAPWGTESNKMSFVIIPTTTNQTPLVYWTFDEPNTNQTFCNGDVMNPVGYKSSLTQKTVTPHSDNTTTLENIIKTLQIASPLNSFNPPYTNIENVSFHDNTVYMGPINGWAGSSIFSCAWIPFVEKNLEQFANIKNIIWDTFQEDSLKTSVNVYFNNTIFDPGLNDCSNVYSVTREIKPTKAVAQAALEELLKGTTKQEEKLGYLSNINAGVNIQKISIKDGLAKIDFSAELEKNVGGSCRTAAIIAQINETVKQFPSVNNVLISIDDKTEDILQP